MTADRGHHFDHLLFGNDGASNAALCYGHSQREWIRLPDLDLAPSDFDDKAIKVM
jgi:hypothetical protein